jgi:Tol biopolymer transport system component
MRWLLVPLLLGSLASAQSTTLLSRAPDGSVGNGPSVLPSISGDAHYIAFRSQASNLVAGDANGVDDVFRCDRWTGAIVLVSVNLAGSAGDGPSRQSQISRNGRYVVFQSYADDLVTGDTNGVSDIFVRDFVLGRTVRASVSSAGAQSDGGSRYPYISANGRWVVFESQATNLVPGDTNGHKDVFVHDCILDTTEIVSLAFDGSGADDDVLSTSISPDGRYVGFSSSATNLVPGDLNGEMDAFVHDRETGTTVRVSTNASGGEDHGLSADVSLSADAHFAAFYSLAADLVPGDNNGQGDVFVKDLQTGAIERASVSSSGLEGNWNSYYPRISRDGRWIVFFSYADTLVPNDTNWDADIFLRDRSRATTERISLRSNGQEARGDANFATISDDGRYVAFGDAAANLDPPDDNACLDLFVRDRVGAFYSFCSGDGSGPVACPCANSGAPGNGCANSIEAAGARLEASGVPAGDTVQLAASGLSGLLALFLEGDAALPTPVAFGDGLRCTGGQLRRLCSANVSAGDASAPVADEFQPGTSRWYQVYYRDPNPAFCPGATFNVTNGVCVLW